MTVITLMSRYRISFISEILIPFSVVFFLLKPKYTRNIKAYKEIGINCATFTPLNMSISNRYSIPESMEATYKAPMEVINTIISRVLIPIKNISFHFQSLFSKYLDFITLQKYAILKVGKTIAAAMLYNFSDVLGIIYGTIILNGAPSIIINLFNFSFILKIIPSKIIPPPKIPNPMSIL